MHAYVPQKHERDNNSQGNIRKHDPRPVDEGNDRPGPKRIAVSLGIWMAEPRPLVLDRPTEEQIVDDRRDGEYGAGDYGDGEDPELAARLHEAQEHYGEGELDGVCAKGVEEVADEEVAVGNFSLMGRG
jgi:hypothetical protein